VLRPSRFALALALLSAGCTAYEPVRSPRVAVVKSAFRRGLVRDGEYYPGGYFGGRIEEAVKGVPEAQAHARAYGTLSTIGSIALFASEGSIIAGSPIIAATVDDKDARTNAHIGLIIGSLTLLVTGIVLHMAAEPHLYDAANLYNDHLDATRPLPLSVPASRAVHPIEPGAQPGAPSENVDAGGLGQP
jgi:hypothetical protein